MYTYSMEISTKTHLLEFSTFSRLPSMSYIVACNDPWMLLEISILFNERPRESSFVLIKLPYHLQTEAVVPI